MSTGFVSEKELDEKRKKRQEEWERVRRPDEPLEAPEEVYDHRSLFDRLQEQKEKKELEWEEAHKLKNQVRGLDVEEIGFLDYVDNVKLREEKNRRNEEKELLNEYRSAVSSLQEKALGDRVKEDARKPVPLSLKGPAQKSSLIGIVRKKTVSQESKKLATSQGEMPDAANGRGKSEPDANLEAKKPVLKPQIVAVLPGLGTYTDSSDSDLDSSGSETDSPPPKRKLDLLGRAIEKSSES